MLTPPGLGAPRRRPNWHVLGPIVLVTIVVVGIGVWIVTNRGGAIEETASPTPNTTTSTRSQTTQPSPTASTKRLPPLRKPLPAQVVDVNVYNTSDRSGLAVATADALSACNFHVLDFGNDPLDADASVPASIRYGRTGLTSAQTLQLYVPAAQLIDDKRTNSTVDLVLGQGFGALTPPAGARCR